MSMTYLYLVSTCTLQYINFKYCILDCYFCSSEIEIVIFNYMCSSNISLYALNVAHVYLYMYMFYNFRRN